MDISVEGKIKSDEILHIFKKELNDFTNAFKYYYDKHPVSEKLHPPPPILLSDFITSTTSICKTIITIMINTDSEDKTVDEFQVLVPRIRLKPICP